MAGQEGSSADLSLSLGRGYGSHPSSGPGKDGRGNSRATALCRMSPGEVGLGRGGHSYHKKKSVLSLLTANVKEANCRVKSCG